MKKTLTALRAFGCAKKHILVAILLSSLMSNAYGEGDPYKIQDGLMTVYGDCTLKQIESWASQAQSEGTYIEMIEISSIEQQIDTITITVDEYAKLPQVGMMYFATNCNLLFDALTTIEGGAPMIYVGGWYDHTPANLTLTFTKNAIDTSLKDKDVSQKVEIPLISSSMFSRESESNVYFTFGDATEGLTYTYTRDDVTQPYKNVGIISPRDLERDTAAMLFEQGIWDPQQAFATGTFTVAFVGSNFDPVVPEPATGTLSLLALAGLAARRRRK